jgi:hypothetical protein
VNTNADPALYLDSSALVKLVVPEPETEALRRYVFGRAPLASCAIARVELVRAVRRHGPSHVAVARSLLDEVDLTLLDDELLDLAGELDGPLRCLDALHIAAALELSPDLEALVTYDAQMARAAEAHGLTVAAPT